MNSHHFDSLHEAAPYEDSLIYLLVFVMILLSVITGIFSWAFVEPDLFM
jgi:hypothetical protein